MTCDKSFLTYEQQIKMLSDIGQENDYLFTLLGLPYMVLIRQNNMITYIIYKTKKIVEDDEIVHRRR